MKTNVLSQSRAILLFFTALFILSSCGNENIKIKGNLLNAGGKQVFLKELTTTESINLDSATIDDDGDFKLSANVSKTAFYLLHLSKEQNITLILHPGDKLSISGDAKDLTNTYTIDGSSESSTVKELNSKLQETLGKVDELRKAYNDSLGSPNILAVRHRLDSMYLNIENEQKIYTQAFIRKNINSLAALMALYQQLGPRKPLLNPKDHFEYFSMVDSSMMANYPDADATQSLHTLMAEVNEQHRRQVEMEKRTAIGVIAPEIALPSIKGDTIKLSSLKGKYVLLDFWASWCSPCRQENPALTKVYWRYKYAGFEIFQVSLDKSRDAWLKAITADGLAWLHVSELKMWESPSAALYGVESIPTNFLLNKDGEIIAKNLHGESLNAKMKEIFKY